MKSSFLFIIATCSVLTLNAQPVEGTYTNKWESPSGESISYSLTLNLDGTFVFQSTRTYLTSIADETVDAHGFWSLKNHLLILKTTEGADKITSDLNLNKATYLNISTRNPKFNKVNPSFKFFESNVFYAKNMQLFKTETRLSTNE